jgi:hypothetical protein
MHDQLERDAQHSCDGDGDGDAQPNELVSVHDFGFRCERLVSRMPGSVVRRRYKPDHPA